VKRTILQKYFWNGCACVSSQYQPTFSPPMWPGNEATSHTSVTKENPTQVTRLSLLGWGGIWTWDYLKWLVRLWGLTIKTH